MSARMMLAAAKGPERVVLTFTSNATWIAPVTTQRLEVLEGKGANGAAATTASAYIEGADARYYTSGTGNTAGVYTWDSMNSTLNAALATVNAGGSGTVSLPDLSQYSNTHYSYFNVGGSYSNAIAGTASLIEAGGAWGTTGNVTASGTRWISYSYPVAATTGSASTGFGKTFPGGVGVPSTPATYNEVAVTPGGSYPLTVPAGGSITITYYK